VEQNRADQAIIFEGGKGFNRSQAERHETLHQSTDWKTVGGLDMGSPKEDCHREYSYFSFNNRFKIFQEDSSKP
jgi:hypothetical protein